MLTTRFAAPALMLDHPLLVRLDFGQHASGLLLALRSGGIGDAADMALRQIAEREVVSALLPVALAARRAIGERGALAADREKARQFARAGAAKLVQQNRTDFRRIETAGIGAHVGERAVCGRFDVGEICRRYNVGGRVRQGSIGIRHRSHRTGGIGRFRFGQRGGFFRRRTCRDFLDRRLEGVIQAPGSRFHLRHFAFEGVKRFALRFENLIVIGRGRRKPGLAVLLALFRETRITGRVDDLLDARERVLPVSLIDQPHDAGAMRHAEARPDCLDVLDGIAFVRRDVLQKARPEDRPSVARFHAYAEHRRIRHDVFLQAHRRQHERVELVHVALDVKRCFDIGADQTIERGLVFPAVASARRRLDFRQPHIDGPDASFGRFVELLYQRLEIVVADPFIDAIDRLTLLEFVEAFEQVVGMINPRSIGRRHLLRFFKRLLRRHFLETRCFEARCLAGA